MNTSKFEGQRLSFMLTSKSHVIILFPSVKECKDVNLAFLPTSFAILVFFLILDTIVVN